MSNPVQLPTELCPEPVPAQPKRFLAISFGFTAALFVAIVLAVFVGGGTAEATNFTITTTGGPIKDWNTPSTWSPAGVPGSLPGDTVTLTTANSQVQLTTGLANPLSGFSIGGTNILVEVAGGNLTLNGAGSVGTGATLRLTSGGTVGVNANLDVGSGGILNSTGGSIDGGGGIGVLNLNSGGNFTITGATSITNGLELVNAGTITTNGADLGVNNTAWITNNGGTIDLQSAFGITSDLVSTKIDILSGTLIKSGGGGTSIVGLPVNNAGTVETGGGHLLLNHGGIHTGSFNANTPGGRLNLSGTHIANGGAWTNNATGAIGLVGGSLTVNSPVTYGNFILDAGTIAGSSSMTSSTGTFQWNGGDIIGSGGAIFANSVNITGSIGAMNLQNMTLQNDGTGSYTGTGAGALTIGSLGVIDNPGTFNYTGGSKPLVIANGGVFKNEVAPAVFSFIDDAPIMGGGSGKFENYGTVTKTSGAGTSIVFAVFDNQSSATVSNITTGTAIAFSGGGTHFGAFDTAVAGTKIQFSAGTHQFLTGSAFTGSGTFLVSGGVADFDIPFTVANTLQFEQSGGVVTGSGNLTLNAPFTWAGGTHDASSGGGQTIVTNNTNTLTAAFANAVLSGRILSLTGNMTYAPVAANRLAINSGAQLLNSGTFTLAGDFPIQSDLSATPKFVNGVGGVLTKSSSTGTSGFAPFFKSDGTINVNSGTITLQGGGENLGTVNVPGATNKIIIDNSSFTLTASPTFTGNGYLTLQGASGNLTLTAPLTIDNFALLGGTVGAGNLVVNKALFWSGGKMVAPGTTTINALATVDHTTPTQVTTLDGRTFDNNGTFNYNPGTFNLELLNSATLNNKVGANFNILGDRFIASGAGTNAFNNVGSVSKNGGTSGTRFDVALHNTGNIASNVAAGTIIVNGGGSMSAGSLIVGGGSIHFFGGTFTLSGGLLTGASGQIAVNGTGVLNVTSSIISTAPFAVQSGGTLDVAATRVFAVDDLTWTGGTIQGSGQTRITTLGTFGNVAPMTLAGGNLMTVDTTLNYDSGATNFLTLTGSSTLAIENTGTMNLRADGILAGAAPALVTNAGIIQKTLGAGASRIDTQLTSTAGTVGATVGTLHLKSGGGTLNSTTINTGTAAKVQFEGNYFIGAGSSVAGTGTIQVTSGTVQFTPNVTIPFLQFDGGTIAGAGTLLVKNATWNAGMFSTGGAITQDAGGFFDVATAGTKTLARSLTNNGTLRFLASSAVTLQNGATIANNNAATFAAPVTLSCLCAPVSTFQNNNTGTVTASGAANIQIFTDFNNAGTVNVGSSAGFFLKRDGNHTGSFVSTNPSITSFEIGTNTLSAASSISGGGSLHIAGTFLHAGTISMSGTGSGVTFSSGNVTLNGAVTTPSAWFSGATVGGAGSITLNPGGVAGHRWNSGTITGGGTFTVDPTATFSILGTSGPMTLDGRLITNNGTLRYSSPTNTLALTNAGSITNSVGGTFEVTADNAINVGPGGSTIGNFGVFRRLTGTGTATIAPPFTNNGTASLQSGIASFDSFTQIGGTLELNGGHMASGLPVNINGGQVVGAGTINAALHNDAAVRPGLGTTTGILTVTSYTQLSGGTLEIDLGGTTPGTSYDVLATSGTPSLNGTFQANLINAFVPSHGQTFNVLTYGTAPGTDFVTYNFPAFGAGGTWSKAFLASALQITAIVPQADLAVTQSVTPVPHTGENVVFTITVTNAGGSTANSVTLNNVFTGPATLVSATSTLGTCTGANCAIGNLTSGSSAVVTLTLNATSPGMVSNTATASTTTTDPNTPNNSSVVSTVVQPKANVTLSVTDTPDPVNATQPITYTVTINNAGPDAAAGVNVNLNVTNGSITGTAGAFTCGTGTASRSCTAATLPVGATVLTVTVQSGAQGTTSLSAVYTSTTFDANLADNNASQTTTITPKVDLAVTKTGPPAVTAGTQLVYTITIKNFGPSDAPSVVVTDATPAGTTFVSNSGACTTAFPCTIASIASGNTVIITATYDVPANATGSITNNVSVTSTTTDTNGANNAANVTTPVNQQADLSITKTAPSVTPPGGTVDFTITVTNNGPSDASGVVVNDPTPAGLTFVSNSGACATPFPCSLGNLARTQSATITARYAVPATGNGSFTNTASVTATTPDPNGANNSASAVTATSCIETVPVVLSPINGRTNVPTSGRLLWAGTGASSYAIYLGPLNSGGCNVPFASSPVNSLEYSGLLPNTTYQWKIVAVSAGCPDVVTSCHTFTTDAGGCPATITLVKPLSGQVSSPIEFEWLPVANATGYTVFAQVGGSGFNQVGVTTTTKLTATLPTDGTVQWYVVANVTGCGNVQSQTASFNLCNRPSAPIARVVGQATSGQNYRVEWDAVPNAVRYEVQQADNPEFTGATTESTTQTFANFRHEVTTQARALHYRVRAFTNCTPNGSDYSLPIRIVIIPLPAKENPNPSANVPAGSGQVVVQQVFVPGEPNVTLFFTAVADRPWLTVTPPNGTIPPEGITLTVTADSKNLPNGTFTATVIVTITNPLTNVGGISTNGTTTKSVPVSVSLVTPVTPVSNRIEPSGDTLIIPSVGHLDGVNSHWQSDIRVTNVGTQNAKYALTFTPAPGSSQGTKQTTIDVAGGATTALDDIIKNWFGVGSLGDSANGMLEIRSADSQPLTAVASSRTYNVTANGTLGQYIPALPFGGFIGKAAQGSLKQTLSIQQVAQSSAYRTNVGVVEASGQAANVMLSVYNAAGTKLIDIPVNLAGGEQKQLNALLAQNGITNLADGRIEVNVLDGAGKVTAYASVVDNATNDPLLVAGTPITTTNNSNKWVLPGVADLANSLANWRTDMRVFNAGLSSQAATLTLHTPNAAPLTQSVSLQPGQVRNLDDVVKSLFGASNIGGAVHVSTANSANLVVTGRTYNLTSNGTFGQFIPAVTPNDAVGANGKTLHILQVEDSTRYRTNLGLAEVSGQPVTLEVQIVLPDTLATPTLTIPMAANEFRQLGIIRDLALGNVYNARITVKVIEGSGRVTAYGSVVDMTTQDPTYVPAQQ